LLFFDEFSNALKFFYHIAATAGADPGGDEWGDRPPEIFESNFIHHNFLQFRKQ